MKFALNNFSRLLDHNRKAVAFLLFSVLGSAAYGAPEAFTGANVWYNIVIVILVVLCLWILSVIQKATKVLGENGYSVMDFDFPIFKIMSEHGKVVGILITILVLIGMYFVVTYV